MDFVCLVSQTVQVSTYGFLSSITLFPHGAFFGMRSVVGSLGNGRSSITVAIGDITILFSVDCVRVLIMFLSAVGTLDKDIGMFLSAVGTLDKDM
jgi:hypothetical protein